MIKVLFADLNHTLIQPISGEIFQRGIWDMKFRFDVLDKIKEISPEVVFVITNQGGIQENIISSKSFKIQLDYICRCIANYCNCKCYGNFCKTISDLDKYRKPNTLLLEELCNDYWLHPDFCNKDDFLMIGDASGKEGDFSDCDKKCAENFGIKYIDVDDFVNYGNK